MATLHINGVDYQLPHGSGEAAAAVTAMGQILRSGEGTVRVLFGNHETDLHIVGTNVVTWAITP
jgi:hypothetical protein